ncbi:MAG: hypothetical protein B7Z66_07755 [Chromatiales bacterium 21-64-14]|nr:MAG: hypothetical protein B7Z66_07755 [Chromatiales bacterium 21-64-14]
MGLSRIRARVSHHIRLPVFLALLAGMSGPPSIAAAPAGAPHPAPTCQYRVVERFPHDSTAFTEGLVFDHGVLYESTGLRDGSTLRAVDLGTGRILRRRSLPAQVFGEGLTVARGQLIQLTYQSHLGFVYDPKTFAQLRTFHYAGQGWGITFDGKRLIMSNGSATLRLLDPETFQVIGKRIVRDAGRPVTGLNELEYIRGNLYANVWPTDRIARIDPATGTVTGWIRLTGLLDTNQWHRPVAEPNGIAYDPNGDRLLVTGKFWPWLFAIHLMPCPGRADRPYAVPADRQRPAPPRTGP